MRRVADGRVASGPVYETPATYVVGSAPEGDILGTPTPHGEVTHLDTGDGAALRTALGLASSGQRVHARRGNYPTGGAAGVTTIASGVQLTGDGDATRLVLPSSGQMASVDIGGAARLDDLAITMVTVPSGSLSDAGGNRFVYIDGGAVLNRLRIAVLADAGSVEHYPFFWSVLRHQGGSSIVENCRLSGYSSAALGSGSECLVALVTGGGCIVRDSRFLGDIDVPAEIGEGFGNLIQRCRIDSSRIFGVRVQGVFDTQDQAVRDCIIHAAGGVGVGSQYVGDAVVSDTEVTGNTITCVGANGIDIESVSAARRYAGLTITGNTITGDGTGTGIRVAESGGGTNSDVTESGNDVSGFSTLRDVTATG